MKHIELAKNVNLHIDQISKFKDVSININFLSELKSEDNAAWLVLRRYLEDSCQQYPTKAQVSHVLDDMYDARISFVPDSRGKARIIQLISTCVNGKYVKDDALLIKQLDLMYAFLLEPRKEDGHFVEALFNEAKDKSLDIIRSLNDNPSSYADSQAARIFKDYYGMRAYPGDSQVKELKLEDIEQLYDYMINQMAIDIIVVGEVEEDKLVKYFKEKFVFSDREVKKEMAYTANNLTVQQIEEEKSITQSTLVQLYTTHYGILEKNYAAMQVANGILGALPTSFLFQEVREKRSLCYSISSRYVGYDGIIKISTMMEYQNVEEARKLIAQQIDRVKRGDFDDQLLNDTKQMFVNAINSSQDDIRAIMWDDYRNVLIDDGRTDETMLKDFKAVTREDVMSAFGPVELHVDYLLKQKEANHE